MDRMAARPADRPGWRRRRPERLEVRDQIQQLVSLNDGIFEEPSAAS
jgi:hypothetical protein